MTPVNHLLAVGEIAAKAFAHAIQNSPVFPGPEGATYSLKLVSGPEVSGSNWMLIVDVGLPDGEKRIEFSIVQTGWGGFIPGAPDDA